MKTAGTEVRIEYDADQLSVVDKINTALKQHGLVFVDDGLPHDGYCLFTLQAVAKAVALADAEPKLRLVDFLAALEARDSALALEARDSALAKALRVVSNRCDGNEDSEFAFERVWQTLAEKRP